ncbi:uncharacterized protein TM35_000371320 [Trypanosoma theileri]|uniref:Uncharacterized protein n=1 Tax=Trypanosoma theileri TaxID=67003 RepID=A0A1X0NLZ4_9TRYP|nr:uncharacterized protein TM35_000371320 [Trypanosoma theileri]ORC85159.1 hypothetical protein TM35_000371320 [Trypanosoma theileri]
MNEEEKRKEATEVKEEMAVTLPNANGQQEGKDALPPTVTSESTVQLKNGAHGSSTEGIATGNGKTETLSLRKDTLQEPNKKDSKMYGHVQSSTVDDYKHSSALSDDRSGKSEGSSPKRRKARDLTNTYTGFMGDI